MRQGALEEACANPSHVTVVINTIRCSPMKGSMERVRCVVVYIASMKNGPEELSSTSKSLPPQVRLTYQNVLGPTSDVARLCDPSSKL
jgi:hypothetical protein